MVSPDLIIVKRWTWKQFTALAVTVVLSLVLVSLSGYYFGVKDSVDFYNENQLLKVSQDKLTIEFNELQRKLVMQKQISEVDKAANLYAGNSMDSQYQQIRELEREITFFRSIMAPGETLKGLQISRFSWNQQQAEKFNWQLSLIQAGSQGRALIGEVQINLIALRGDEQVTIALTNEDAAKKFKYRFKYFQHLTGTVTIASDLNPISINVSVKPSAGKPLIERQFPWQSDEEKIANVE